MATMAMDMVRKHKYLLSIVLLSTHSLVQANEWTFDPAIKINETYSDNINFNNQNKNSTFVNQTGLSLSSTYIAQYASYNIDLESFYASYSHDSALNDSFISLDGDFNIQLWPNGISLVGSASIQNSPRNTSANVYADIVSGDTVQVERYSSGLSYNISNSQYNLSSTLVYNTTRSEDNISEQDGYTATLNSRNGNNSRYIFWDLSNNYNERENNNRTSRSYQSETKIGLITPYKLNPFIRYYDEDNSGNLASNQQIESNSYGAGLRWLLTPRLIVDLSYNIPLNKSKLTDNEQKDNYYDISINWQPSRRTTLNANISQRFYGDSYNLNLTHKNKRLTNTIIYDESIQTFTRDSFEIDNEGFFLCPQDIDNFTYDQCFINNTNPLDDNSLRVIPSLKLVEDDNFSLNKRLNWISSLALSRTTFRLSLQRNERLNLSTNVEGLRQNADFSISRKISGYSTIEASASYTETNNFINLPREQNSQYRYYKINYKRELNKTLSFDINISHLNRASDPAVFVYKENRISLELKKVL
ncbi:TIGR03016 family PEP-CTERM system-associated outer membrane protein [Pseudocolwellia agarivorans]|uniref:TIGR03016 family PEP-CTERM system-associated outer membrane protein n=1 Tax=Pseudocolwellia agarivorans TaxID=1911682 RepID=UPI00098426BA|nr:TIGR03016 family PEP-CTERM system-associated outer membrane protein [Pseudocolwellia agarivorans]